MSIDQSAVSRVTGVLVSPAIFESGIARYLPQRVALVGQGNSLTSYATTPLQVFTAKEVGDTYGYGSPLHLAAMKLFPVAGGGIGAVPVTVYPLEDDASGVPAAGAIEVTGTATETKTMEVTIGGITVNVAITTGDLAAAVMTAIKAAIDAQVNVPVITGTITTEIPLTAKWDGETGNDILLENTDVDGLTVSYTVMASGASNPDIDDALNQINQVWETLVCNCLNYDDATSQAALDAWGEARWDQLVKKPVWAITGAHDSFATVGAVTDAVKTKKINCIIPAPGSRECPWVIAASAVAEIAKTANNNPPQNYKGGLTGLEPGVDGSQFGYSSLDATVKLGCSTTLIIGGEIALNDTVTTYHPDGEEPPAYRYGVDIVKLQNIVYNMRLIFEADEWKGAPLLPDTSVTVNPTAKQPKDARTALINLATNLELNAIISDADFTIENLTVSINASNPKRLDVVFPVKLSGNVEIISSDLKFGFFFGQAA
jgi:phage tail sheath gpL-like